jgi:uncharacterized protein YcbK (DUF882 family)
MSKKLSPHFSEDEFRCKCCQSLPPGGIAVELIGALENLRAILGNEPIHILSGYRCASHNKKVGGAKNSQHVLGRAADIEIDSAYPYTVAEAAETIPEFADGGIGRYETFTHVDVRGCYGQRKARWSKLK